MITTEQKARIEELEAIETLKAEEAEELKTLQALVPEDPNQDEFDAGWDELEGKTPALKADADDTRTPEQIEKDQEAQLEKDKTEKEEKEQAAKEAAAKESQSTESGTDGDILNVAPANSDKKPDSADKDKNIDPRDAEITALKAEQEAQAQKMRSWEGRLKAADKRAVEAEQKLKDTKGKDKKESDDVSPTEDDVELGKFFKEYPDLEAPMKKVAEKLATKIFEEKIGDKIETLETNQSEAQETADTEADRVHMASINAAHPDWEKIYDSGALHTWITRQPGYLQPRLTEILKKGSAQEVIDMFDSYKRAAGKGQETATNSASSEETKKKAAALEAVPASSGGPKKGAVKITKDDFDGAWDELEKEDKKQK